MAWRGAACCGMAWCSVVQCVLIDLETQILPHLPPMGVPVLWRDWPVKVKISHFLVSNVPSKFYRLVVVLLLLLLDVFFLCPND